MTDTDCKEKTIWSLKDMAENFMVSEETIRRKVASGELPEPDLGEITGRGAKRWVVQNLFIYLRERKQYRNPNERLL